MSKIVRKVARIFGDSAPAADGGVSQFGSLAAGSPVFSKDPAVIQSLANFLGGWSAAILGSSNPAIEDMNAVCYVYAYQLAYLMQQGIPEYDATTTYYIGSLVNGGDGQIFVALQNGITGQPTTDSTKWRTLAGFYDTAPLIDLVVPSGKTYFQPVPRVASSQHWTVASGGIFFALGPVTVDGVLTVNGTLIIQ